MTSREWGRDASKEMRVFTKRQEFLSRRNINKQGARHMMWRDKDYRKDGRSGRNK